MNPRTLASALRNFCTHAARVAGLQLRLDTATNLMRHPYDDALVPR
jgi:hypothetical protein